MPDRRSRYFTKGRDKSDERQVKVVVSPSDVVALAGTPDPFGASAGLFGEIGFETSRLLTELKTASEVVILASLLSAGCSLAVAMAAGVSERDGRLACCD